MSSPFEDVRVLRGITGAGVLDCKHALDASTSSGARRIDDAIIWLQKNGRIRQIRRADKVAEQGRVHAYVHTGGRIGVLVEISSETDFVARGEEFKALTYDVAMHICAAYPEYVSHDDVPAEVKATQADIAWENAEKRGKNPEITERIAAGLMKKWQAEVCLLNQPFVKDPVVTIRQLIDTFASKVGEKIVVRRFARFEVGPGR